MTDKRCETCGLWVPYNSLAAGRGECCLPATPNAPVKVGFIVTPQEPTVLLTAFDFGCVRWLGRPEEKTNNAASAKEEAMTDNDLVDRLAEPKIIFLDIDGVLNGHEWDDEAKSCSIRRECVAHLNRIIRETRAKIVVSSAWRYMILGGDMTDRGFGYMLRTHGLLSGGNGSVVIGHVGPDGDPKNREDRAEQIRAWFGCREDVGRTLVIDDEDFGFSRHGLPFIQTDSATGLTARDADRAIAWLNGM